MKIERNHNGDNGSILMEVLLMLAILIVIFPIIQKNVKERSDNARNELVVKDMMRIKAAVENYLEKGNGEKGPCFIPTGETEVKCSGEFPAGSVITISDDPNSGLHEWFDVYGLAPSLKSENIIGQTYSVKIRRVDTTISNKTTSAYDAIIVADGNADISDLRLRDIVNASKGYGGYLEGTVIYGANWSLDSTVWQITEDQHPIVFKAGSLKREYQYITKNGADDNTRTMKTDLLMNFNDILRAGSMVVQKIAQSTGPAIGGKAEVSSLKVSSGTASASEVSLGDAGTDGALTLNNTMTVDSSGSVTFPNGISCDHDVNDSDCKLKFEDASTAKLALEDNMTVKNKLDITAGEVNYLREVKAPVLENISNSELKLFVGNQIDVPQDDARIARVKNLFVNSAEISQQAGAAGLTFKKIDMSNDPDRYVVDAGVGLKFKGKDIVVREVNKLFENTPKYGGINITDKTPISMILRALNYAYADIYRLAKDSYDYAAAPIDGSISYGDCNRCYLDSALCAADPNHPSAEWDKGRHTVCVLQEDGTVKYSSP